MIELEQVASIIEKMESTIFVENLIKNREINPLTIYLLNKENLCETFHWTPKDLSEMDPFTVDAFVAILKGKHKGREARGK